jgi:4-carboxymuconolactone decarboxylase
LKRFAPPAVYEVAPGLGQFTDEILFGEVWLRPELKPRDRSLITLAALISGGKMAQVGGHVTRALDNGVKPEEIGEVITQMAFYAGWPNAISAVDETKKVFQVRRIGPVPARENRLNLDPAAEAIHSGMVDAAMVPGSPVLAELTNRVLFGQLWRRSELTPRDRSLVTLAALISLGESGQLAFHARQALDHGLTAAELSEIPAHLAFYAGWPRATSAVPELAKVLPPAQLSEEELRLDPR